MKRPSLLIARSLLFTSSSSLSQTASATISSQLADNLLAFSHYRRPSITRAFRLGGIFSSSSPPLLFVRRNTHRAISSLRSTISQDDEPRTGWLHNTEAPKYYTPPSDDSSLARQMLMVEMMKSYRNHRIVHPPAFHPCGEGQRMVVTEHKVTVPLTYPDLLEAAKKSVGSEHRIVTVDNIDDGFHRKESFDGPKLDIYFSITELVSTSADEEFFHSLIGMTPLHRAERYKTRSAGVDPSRMFLYLQGGPGFGCASPVSGLSLDSPTSSWAAQVLLGGLTNEDGKSFQRVVLMDQRGTGRSTPINKQRLQKIFPDLFSLDSADINSPSPNTQLLEAKFDKALSEATIYMTNFRADSIVRDAEWIKQTLITAESDNQGELNVPKPWGAALGQSFGGFCIMTYLSSITHPPKICLFTGGIAPMNTPVREVYDRLWLRVRERNLRYYEMYPGDVKVVKRIVRKLLADKVQLPSGGILTARRFLQLGLALGGTPGVSFATLHSLVNSAFVDDQSEDLSHSFIKQVEAHQSFDDAPLYFLLHESIYGDGQGVATGWAAHTSFETIRTSTLKEFDYTQSVNNKGTPTLFFGEMVFPWMADGDFAEVSGHGMKSLSEALAMSTDWLPLFDAQNMRTVLVGGALDSRKTKSAAAVYYEDMYVDFDCCMKLVQRGAPLEGVKVWVTNDYQHSGLRDDGATIVKKLLAMAKGCVRVPS